MELDILINSTPEHWEYFEKGTYIVNRNSKEFQNINKEFVKENYEIRRLLKNIDINRYNQFVVRQQFLSVNNPAQQYYRVRNYVNIPEDLVDDAIKYHLDYRRFEEDIDFTTDVGNVNGDAVLVIKVVTDNPYEEFIPTKNSDFYIEYVAYVD